MNEDPTVAGDYETNWQPDWIAISQGERIGITVDDGCFVFLMHDGEKWGQMGWVPPEAILRAAELQQKQNVCDKETILKIKNGVDLLANDPQPDTLVIKVAPEDEEVTLGFLARLGDKVTWGKVD